MLSRVIAFLAIILVLSNTSGLSQARFEPGSRFTDILIYVEPGVLQFPVHRGQVNPEEVMFNVPELDELVSTLRVQRILRSFPDADPADSVLVNEFGQRITLLDRTRVFRFRLPPGKDLEAVARQLQGVPGILFAETIPAYEFFSTDPDDDHFATRQWNLHHTGQGYQPAVGTSGRADIRAPEAWAIYTGSSSVKIGIIDSGVLLTHEDLDGKASGDSPSTPHGTNVAGIAAAHTENEQGIAGVDWNAQIISKDISSFDPEVIYDKTISALSEGVNVLNLSWGDDTFNTIVAKAFATAYEMNVLSVAATGNSSSEQTNYPAGLTNVMAVGASNHENQRSGSSTFGDHMDVVAPGGWGVNPALTTDIYTSWGSGNSDYDYNTGSSMAAPHVSGIASLLRGYGQDVLSKTLYNDDIKNIIQLSADKVGGYSYDGNGWHEQMGYGRVNAYKALERLQSPYVLNHQTATGGTEHSTSSQYYMYIYGASGIPDGRYTVRRREVRKTVSFSYMDQVWIWGRGAASVGWDMTTTSDHGNFAMGFAEPVPGTLTNTGVTLRTYIYEVKKYTSIGQLVHDYGWHPSTSDNVQFAYTVHGVYGAGPPSVSITGPSNMFEGTSDTFTANASGGTSPYSYQWYYMNEADGGWTTAGSTSSTYWHTAGAPNGETVRVVVTDAASAQNEDSHFFTIIGMAKEIAKEPVPDSYQLHAAYPNPFNPSSVIRYDLPEAAHVSLRIYNVTGQWVTTLTDGQINAGFQEVSWDAARFPSGMYILRMQAVGASGESHQFVQKLTLLK